MIGGEAHLPSRGRRKIALDDLCGGVKLPGGLGQARPTEDLDLVTGEAHQHLAQGLLGEHHGGHDLDIGERCDVRAQRFAGDVKRHLDEGGTRQDHLPVDHVVVELGHERRIEMAMPFEPIGRAAGADQRMPGARHHRTHHLGRLGQPEAAALPRVERQADASRRIVTEQDGFIDACTRHEGAGDRLGDRVAAYGLAVQHADGRDLDAQRLHGVADMRQQRRARADFDEDARALARRLLQGVAEAHRLTDIAPPVAGAEAGPGQHRAGHRRDHGGVPGRCRQPVEVAQERTLGRVHQPTMERVFEVELAPAATLARQRLHGRLDCGLGAGDGDRLRAVIGGDVEGGVLGEERLHFLDRAEQHRHGAESPRRLLVLAAEEDDPDGLLEAEDAGGFRRGDLAHAVAEDEIRRQALRAQSRGRGALNGED